MFEGDRDMADESKGRSGSDCHGARQEVQPADCGRECKAVYAHDPLGQKYDGDRRYHLRRQGSESGEVGYAMHGLSPTFDDQAKTSIDWSRMLAFPFSAIASVFQ